MGRRSRSFVPLDVDRRAPLKGAAMGLSITRYPQAPPTDPLSAIVQVELFY